MNYRTILISTLLSMQALRTIEATVWNKKEDGRLLLNDTAGLSRAGVSNVLRESNVCPFQKWQGATNAWNGSLPKACSRGQCHCRPKSFKNSYRKASYVILASVTSRISTCMYCIRRRGSSIGNRFQVNTYSLLVQRHFKKTSDTRSIIFAQSFDHPDMCGVRMEKREFLFFLDDPTNADDNFWFNSGRWFVINSCEKHMRWSDVPDFQKRRLERVSTS